MMALTIGQLARESGYRPQTIREYEALGLVPAPKRTPGNQRRYDCRHAERLAFIRHARELGLPLSAIRELLNSSNSAQDICRHADEIARRFLGHVETRLISLNALKAELKNLVGGARREGNG